MNFKQLILFGSVISVVGKTTLGIMEPILMIHLSN